MAKRKSQVTPAAAAGHADTTPAPPAAVQAPKPRQIAIVGTAPSSRDLAPYNDPNWELWVLKLMGVPRWDVFFEIHDSVEGKKRWPKEYWNWLCQEHRDHKGELKPLITQGKVNEWPNSKPYPLPDVLQHFGAHWDRPICTYFTNQVSYMICLAMLQPNVERIGLWGVDMAQHQVGGKSEYAHQRPSCEYFLGVAAGRGIKIYIPPQSDLLKCRKLYAFEQDDWDEKSKAREKELIKRRQEAMQKFEQAKAEFYHLQGAYDDMTWQAQWRQSGMGEVGDLVAVEKLG